jgi:hypothetical protein
MGSKRRQPQGFMLTFHPSTCTEQFEWADVFLFYHCRLTKSKGIPAVPSPGQFTLTEYLSHWFTFSNGFSNFVSHMASPNIDHGSHAASSLMFKNLSRGIEETMRHESLQVAVSCGGRLEDMVKGETTHATSSERICEKKRPGIVVLKLRRQSR